MSTVWARVLNKKRNILSNHHAFASRLVKHLSDDSDYYVMTENRKMPFAWCAPESLKSRQFSHKSDVYSYGVTLFELFSFGEEPWLGYGGAQILRMVEDGKRLPKPDACSAHFYKEVMLRCWMLRPDDRPTFQELLSSLPDFTPYDVKASEAFGPDVVDTSAPTSSHALKVAVGDVVTIIDADPSHNYCQAQNRQSFAFGHLPRRIARASRRLAKSDISEPLRHSLVHAGHGDADPKKTFGEIEKIDEVFLRNPLPPIDVPTSTPNTKPIDAPLIDFGSESVDASSTAPAGTRQPPLYANLLDEPAGIATPPTPQLYQNMPSVATQKERNGDEPIRKLPPLSFPPPPTRSKRQPATSTSAATDPSLLFTDLQSPVTSQSSRSHSFCSLNNVVPSAPPAPTDAQSSSMPRPSAQYAPAAPTGAQSSSMPRSSAQYASVVKTPKASLPLASRPTSILEDYIARVMEAVPGATSHDVKEALGHARFSVEGASRRLRVRRLQTCFPTLPEAELESALDRYNGDLAAAGSLLAEQQNIL